MAEILRFFGPQLTAQYREYDKRRGAQGPTKAAFEATQLTEIERFFHIVEERTYSPLAS